jgi:hypothetical protein
MSKVIKLPSRRPGIARPAPTGVGAPGNVVRFTGPVRTRAPSRRPTPIDWCADLDRLAEIARQTVLIEAARALMDAIPEGGSVECRLGGMRVPMTRRMASGWQSDLIEAREELLATLDDEDRLMRRAGAAFRLRHTL